MFNPKLLIMRKSIFRRRGMLFLLLFGLAISFAFAQERTVTGKVTSEEGELPGVNIVIQGTVTGAVTNVSGNYSIVVPGPDAVLVFSSIGFTTQSVAVGNQSTINLAMVADVTSLDEIVVTAYATQQKKDITGSISTIKSEELSAMPQGNVTQQMQGRVAGVTVTQDSRPGQAAKVRIRGFGSFQENSPLYVVDGVPTTDINTINPADVESLTVLKDAGAASIYGSRASNGVILITTKKGKSGMSINYNMYAGTQNPGAGPDNILDTQGMADLTWLVNANDGTVENHPVYGPSSGAPTLPTWAANTVWFDEVTRNAPIQNHDLSLSGGNETSKYYAGFGYFDQEGTILTNWYKRFSARFNSEFKIKDRVTIGENLNITHRSDNGVTSNSSESGAIMMSVYRAQPILPVKWNSGTYVGQATAHTFENGDWAGTGVAPRLGNGENWVADAVNDQDDRWQDIRFLGNVFVDVKIIEGLNFKTSFGGSLNSWHQTNWTEKQYWNAENATTSTYGENSGYGSDWTWTNTLTYNNQFGNHYILAVAGYEAVKTGIGREVGAQRAGYFSRALTYRTVSNGASLQSGWSNYWTPRSLVSQFVRADYNFLNKYYVSATIRRDGSSVFGADTRYGTFPSVTAAWRISEESFLAGTSFISDLKIRAGYGTMGNQLAVATANQFFLYGGAPNATYYDLNGTTNSSLQGFSPTRIGNPDAKWETAVNMNVGFDAVLLDRKFEIILDYYSKQNQDLLFDPELPGTAGNAGRPYINIGEMKNTGIDLQFIYRQIWSDFSFEANASFTTVKNEIIKIADGYEFFDDGGSRIGGFNRNEVGHSMGEFFGYNVIGLFQDAAEVDAAAIQDGAEPGVFRYEDTDGSGTIDPDDRVFMGKPIADFTFGLNLALGYKDFDLTAFFYGSQGNEIFNYNKYWTDFWPSFQGVKSTDLLNDSWTPSNTGASVPKASQASTFSTNTQSTSYYIEDGSFLRLKNLTIGYTLPNSFLGNVFSSARIYVQGVNLLTMTKYSGLDPELASFNDGFMGVDEGSLPSTKQFLFGINLGF